MHHRPRWPAALAAGTALSIAIAAHAEPLYRGLEVPHLDWTAYAGAAWTDNATLETGGPKDTIEAVGVDASIFRHAGGLTVDANGDLHREHYVDHTFRDDTLGRGIASLDYAFVPERFTWALTDAFGQVNDNPFLPSTPRNRVSANVLSTGPEAALKVGTATSLTLGAAYDRADFGHTTVNAVDNHRYNAHLGLVEQLTSLSAVSLNASAARVEYQGPNAGGYDQDDLYASFTSRSTRAGVAIDLGATEVRTGGRKQHDPLARATVFRRLSPFWNFNLAAGTQILNSGQSFLAAAAGGTVVGGGVVPPSGPPGGAYTDVLLTQNLDRATFARVSLDFSRSRTGFGVYAGYSRDRFEFATSNLDRTLSDAGLRLSRRLRPTLDAHADFSYWKREPVAASPGDHTTYADAGLRWHLGSSVALDLSARSEHRVADRGGIGYRDRIVFLRLSYGSPGHGGGPRGAEPPGLPGAPGG